jgi:hypothetical protein
VGLVRRLLRGRKERQERWRRWFRRMSRVVGRGWLRDSVHREYQRGLLGAVGCGRNELAVRIYIWEVCMHTPVREWLLPIQVPFRKLPMQYTL